MYWQTQHAGLVDCVRQTGLPHLVHHYRALGNVGALDELAKLVRTRAQLPGRETFHLAHLLMEAAEG